jgi:hypothetical protein
MRGSEREVLRVAGLQIDPARQGLQQKPGSQQNRI